MNTAEQKRVPTPEPDPRIQPREYLEHLIRESGKSHVFINTPDQQILLFPGYADDYTYLSPLCIVVGKPGQDFKFHESTELLTAFTEDFDESYDLETDPDGKKWIDMAVLNMPTEIDSGLKTRIRFRSQDDNVERITDPGLVREAEIAIACAVKKAKLEEARIKGQQPEEPNPEPEWIGSSELV